MTKRTTNIYSVLLLILSGLPCSAQHESSVIANNKDAIDAQLERRISQDIEEYAKFKAGWTSRPEAIQKLREQAKLLDKHFGGEAENAREILARLGDSEQIERIGCEFYDYGRDTTHQFEAAKKLQLIRGYASIRILAEVMLDPIKHSFSQPGEISPGRSLARIYALKSLAHLVPELGIPVQVSMAGIPPKEEQIRDWYDWLGTHRDQLSRLQPSEARILSRTDCLKMRGMNITLHEVSSVYVTTSSGGSTRLDKYRITNRGDKFFIGKYEVDQTALAALLNALSSPLPEPLTLNDLGIDDDWLASNADAALSTLPTTMPGNRNRKEPEVLDAEERRQFLIVFTENDRMNDILQACFHAKSPGDPPRVKLAIKLRDGQTVELRSQGSGPFLVPWELWSPEKTELFDHRISLAIAALLPKGASNRDRLSNTDDYDLRRRLALELADFIKSVCPNKECPKLQD